MGLLKSKSLSFLRGGASRGRARPLDNDNDSDNDELPSKSDRRLTKELGDIAKDPFEGWSIGPVADDPFHCQGVLVGPPDSVYSGGMFFLYLKFPRNYPFSPPSVYFTTRIYHPNVSLNGNVALDLLRDEWSVGCKIISIFVALQHLLLMPNLETAVNLEAATLFETDRTNYRLMAMEWTKAYASG